jgi:hypothetical protein
MLIGLIIGLFCLGGVGVAYVNRDDLSDKSKTRQLAPYLVAAIVAIGIGVAVIVLTAHQTNICGTPGDGTYSRCS